MMSEKKTTTKKTARTTKSTSTKAAATKKAAPKTKATKATTQTTSKKTTPKATNATPASKTTPAKSPTTTKAAKTAKTDSGKAAKTASKTTKAAGTKATKAAGTKAPATKAPKASATKTAKADSGKAAASKATKAASTKASATTAAKATATKAAKVAKAPKASATKAPKVTKASATKAAKAPKASATKAPKVARATKAAKAEKAPTASKTAATKAAAVKTKETGAKSEQASSTEKAAKKSKATTARTSAAKASKTTTAKKSPTNPTAKETPKAKAASTKATSKKPASTKATSKKPATPRLSEAMVEDVDLAADALPASLMARLAVASKQTPGSDPVEHFTKLVANRPGLGHDRQDDDLDDDRDEDDDDFESGDEWEAAEDTSGDDIENEDDEEIFSEEPLGHEPIRVVQARLRARPGQQTEPRRHAPRETHPTRSRRDFDEIDNRPQRSDALPPGMVKIKSFHPDVVPGGGYIEQLVRADQVPYGAIIVSGQPEGKARTSNQPERGRQEERDGNQAALLPAGGILAAGRKLVSEGRLSIRQEDRVAVDTTPDNPPASNPSTTQPNSPAHPPSPPLASTSASPQTAAGGLSGIGAGFLQGLPSANRFGNPSAENAKQALNAVFGGGAPAAATPTQTPPAQASPAAAVRPALPVAPPSRPEASSSAPTRGVTPNRGPGMILDGRMIETAGSKRDEQTSLARLRELRAPHDLMRIFELQVNPPQEKPVDAHAFLWPEGQIGLMGRVNDTDPRPRVWPEEGIFGLGREERERELQRWSLREWWEGLEDKGHTPIAAFAGTRTIRDTLQVAFVYDASYNIYRLYQAPGHELAGAYPMLIVSEGFVKAAHINLDGVGERERITPERMQAILGPHSPPSPADLIFSAVPCMADGKPLPMNAPAHLAQLRDQMEGLFRFPQLELPDPLGGSGSIKLHLGLWEISQDDANGAQLRDAAANERSLTFQASAGYLSDLVRRELWRMKGQPAQLWSGYTPKQVAESIRVALREDHYNMQGFQPKKPGDYCYDPETGAFQIVLKRKHSTHTLLLRGTDGSEEAILCALTLYSSHKDNEGLNPLTDYAGLLQASQWKELWPGISWKDAWLLAPGGESRCAWANAQGLPNTPAVRHMPAWHRGIALGLFLMDF